MEIIVVTTRRPEAPFSGRAVVIDGRYEYETHRQSEVLDEVI